MRRACDRILVRLPNWLGDLLMARPAVRTLALAHPGARVRAIAPPSLAGIAEWDGAFETVHAWPDEARDRTRLAEELAAWRPDVALVLPPSFASAWWTRSTGARVRIGFRGEGRDWLLTHAVGRPARGERHLSEEYRELAALAGADVVSTATTAMTAAMAAEDVLPVPAAVRAAAAPWVRRGAAGTYAVLGPGATYGPAKRWDAERFAAVGRALVARGLAVLVCGAASERADCEAVAAGIGSGAFALAGATDLATQAAVCAGAAIAVCNDSGLAHLSAATGAPTLAVFGSTSSAWTAPLGPRVRVVQHAPVCAPCFQRTCRIGYRCLDAVTAAEVLAACLAIAA
jgi:heptosyltransferase-2